MNGTPILQDGKLVGVVTYVFVNVSSNEYGVNNEKMLDAAE